jgi:type III restriction enzyme
MELKFDPNQDYQTRAIESVAGLLEGQPYVEADPFFPLQAGFAAVPNLLTITREDLLLNLNSVQQRNGLPSDDDFAPIAENIETADGIKQAWFPNFSVEMETGTGKTYVYLRTALELYRCYGLRKFIVVVPSVAIREGVLKTLQITEKHFQELYENLPYHYYIYDSANLTKVRQFALSDSVEIMVMTIAAFNKAANIIRQSTEKLSGETPIYLVQATRPVLILDEPQNMESEKQVAALAMLDPLFALRYSATHRNHYNLVYRLTPYDAYRQAIVKKIQVASVLQENDYNRVFIRLDGIVAKKQTLTARLAVHKLQKNGTAKEQVVTVRQGESLADKTGRPEYHGFDVQQIDLFSSKGCCCMNPKQAISRTLQSDK